MIYFDNNATTAIEPTAVDAMQPFLREHYANPSSGTTFARHTRQAVARAREQVAALLGCEPGEVIFTSGGTEADNAAIFSATQIHPDRKHLVTAATEHDAVLNHCAWLEANHGYEVTRVAVNRDGVPDLAELAAAIRPGQTALVSVMAANNETGVCAPVAQAAALAEENGVLFHTDAVQMAGKVPLRLASTAIHYLAISGHKFHAPKGIGALFVSKRVRFQPMLLGGGQESHRRAGTENVPHVVALGQAAACALRHLEMHEAGEDPVRTLRDAFETGLRALLPGVEINGAGAPRTPNTTSVRIPGAPAEGMLILLDQQGICCSAGSACNTGALHPSHVLAAMGRSPEEARECLRFSFSRFNTDGEIQAALPVIAAAADKMRRLR